ncbi:hypothetical protein [Streptomyces sp. NPDC052811]|uniref:hypothetical protein n=1 Tax=Streptomyces sp. NPDC052811 TaxID=3155731 RepID=UPI003447E133
MLRIDPNHIDPRQWTVVQFGNGWGHGVIGRSRTMSYDFGSPTGLGPAVHNTTANPIIRTIGGEKTIGTETSFSVSTTVEAGFFDTMKVSVTTSYGRTWTSSTTFKDSLEITIPPGYMSWLELRPVMRRVQGHFVHVRRDPVSNVRMWFAGDVIAPGLEGNLADVIQVREAPVSKEYARFLKSAAEKTPGTVHSKDGAISLPASWIMDSLGKHATSTDVAKVRGQ